MDKKTVWISACLWIFLHAAACLVCSTLPTQITESLQLIRNDYNMYFFAKAIVLIFVSVLLGITHSCCSLNFIYFIGILNSVWAAADAYFIWKLLGSCNDKPTDYIDIIIINIIHSLVGLIAFVVICIWYTRGSKKNHEDVESQTEDQQAFYESKRRGFTSSMFHRESERKHIHPTNNNDEANENHTSTTDIREDDIQEDDETINTDETTDISKLTTSSTANLLTQTPCTCSPPNRKKRKRDISRTYHRSNSSSKETQTDPISSDEDNTTSITCPLRGAAPSEEIESEHADDNQQATNPLTDENEQLIPFNHTDRIIIKDNFPSRTVCHDCLIGVTHASCRYFVENVPG